MTDYVICGEVCKYVGKCGHRYVHEAKDSGNTKCSSSAYRWAYVATCDRSGNCRLATIEEIAAARLRGELKSK